MFLIIDDEGRDGPAYYLDSKSVKSYVIGRHPVAYRNTKAPELLPGEQWLQILRTTDSSRAHGELRFHNSQWHLIAKAFRHSKGIWQVDGLGSDRKQRSPTKQAGHLEQSDSTHGELTLFLQQTPEEQSPLELFQSLSLKSGMTLQFGSCKVRVQQRLGAPETEGLQARPRYRREWLTPEDDRGTAPDDERVKCHWGQLRAVIDANRSLLRESADGRTAKPGLAELAARRLVDLTAAEYAFIVDCGSKAQPLGPAYFKLRHADQVQTTPLDASSARRELDRQLPRNEADRERLFDLEASQLVDIWNSVKQSDAKQQLAARSALVTVPVYTSQSDPAVDGRVEAFLLLAGPELMAADVDAAILIAEGLSAAFERQRVGGDTRDIVGQSEKLVALMDEASQLAANLKKGLLCAP